MDFEGFIGPSYSGRSTFIGAEELYNLYPEVATSPGARPRSRVHYYPTPGLTLFGIAGNGPIRGMLHLDGRFYVVSGSEVYSVNSSGVATLLGSVAMNSQPVSMSTNGTAGDQLLIASGGFLYVVTLSTGVLAPVSVPAGMENVLMVDFLNSRFLALPYGGRAFYYSDREDGTTWSALQVAEKSQSSDNIRALVVDHNQIWLPGSKTTEVWYSTGDANTPFAPIPSGPLSYGIKAPWSIRKVMNSICWVAETEDGFGQAIVIDGYSPTRFSSDAVEQHFSGYAGLGDAIGMTYQEEGHTFYLLHSLQDGHTWGFDFATKMWHRRGLWEDGVYKAHLGRCHALAFGRHLVGSRIDGSIYTQSLQLLDDAGMAIRRMRRSPLLDTRRNRFTVDRLMVECEPGIGLVTGQGSSPLLMMRYSIDGGKTWSEELTGERGEIGEYEQITEWRRLGDGRDWVFEVSDSEPTNHAWAGAWIEGSGRAW